MTRNGRAALWGAKRDYDADRLTIHASLILGIEPVPVQSGCPPRRPAINKRTASTAGYVLSRRSALWLARSSRPLALKAQRRQLQP